MHGYSGINLFEATYESFVNSNFKKARISAEDTLISFDQYLTNFEGSSPLAYGFSGLPGIFWTITYMRRLGFLSFETETLFSEFVPLLDKIATQEAEKKNYDYFCGVIGILLFYKKANLFDSKESLQIQILNILNRQANHVNNEQLYWDLLMVDPDNNYKVNKGVVNFGLSHGIPSIICCLSLFNKNLRDKSFPLVNNSINFILDRRADKLFERRTQSQFPYSANIYETSDPADYTSRLGWCYGDLGIACMLWKAGEIFNKNEWRDLSYKIIMESCNRRNLKTNNVQDAGLCHGSSGILQIYNRFYRRFPETELKKAIKYWAQVTLDFSKNNNSLAGYNVYEPQANKGGAKLKEPGFIQGISGIGLALLGLLEPDSMDWDESLFIS